ncbi:callose synthase 5 [Cocos nucifera]|nr:callose synthase 5 [Cocos nucifera]
MSEIVPEGPSHRPRSLGRLSRDPDNVPEPFDSEKLPSTLTGIRPFLRVANQIESESPRVAYLCRFHAFEKAHLMDPHSSGRGVRQFKTSLLQRLEKDEKATVQEGKHDAQELKSFLNGKKMMNQHDIASVLSEVLKAVASGAHPKVPVAGEELEEKSSSYRPYNILPLDSRGGQQAIMLLPEIKAAVSAVRNIRGLPLACTHQETDAYADVLEWLQCWFGFQNGNVANQREHLILLLANIHARLNPKPVSMMKLDDRAVNKLMLKIFKNYLNWCKFLGRESNIWLPSVKQEVQQYKILYIALYLLIWGEASNLRLMPECLCYIFHHMAYEVRGVLTGAVSINTGKKVEPTYGGECESFLNNVVTPIYRVIYEEAQKNQNGTADHSTWRNYDDLNEYFWSVDCFKLGWPMRLDNDFFCTSSSTKSEQPKHDTQAATNTSRQQKWLGKTNFVEIRSFWHIFRSFDRMWTFFVLALQVMIIMAWHDLETPLQLLDPMIFEDILSIFVTNAVLRFIQVTLDIAFTWKARHTVNFNQKLRFLVKFVIAAAWAVTLPVSYASSHGDSLCHTKHPESNIDSFCLSPYMIVVAVYLMTNAIGVALFFVPVVSSYIETSNSWVCNILSWWAQIKPLVEPTKQIMKVSVNEYDWHELFPEVKSNAGAILAVWSPIILVYFMDTQIWYSIFCTIFGGIYGIVHHLGEIRTMGMVRTRFDCLPSAFNVLLVPHSSQNANKRSFRSFLQNNIFKDSKIERTDFARFALVWNQIIRSFRMEDLISNREMDLMIMPLSSGLTSGPFSTAVNMTQDFVGKHEHLHRKLKKDNYMFCAVKECYDSVKSIFKFLVVGELEIRIVDTIFNEIERSIRNSSLLVDFKMHELQTLHDKFVQLVKLLFENDKDHRDKVVILLQDIVEILINDMMVDGCRILDMINCSQIMKWNDDGLSRDPEPELFASNAPNSICFPLPADGPLKEQVKRLFLLLTVKETAMDIPTNLEARRRISFFATSLFMDMPVAPKVRNMLSFRGSIAIEREYNKKNSQQSLFAQFDALADMKFTYVISCQMFGEQKSSGDPHAQDIIDLMIRYPSLRVAYIEESEKIAGSKPHKVYHSVLVKAGNNLDQEIYRIKLPGCPIIGEGKPENQNHAIIFTRGEALQTIDMNQDNYLEEACKMRNLLQEFLKNHGEHHPTILGLREHIFTGSVSSLAGFMSYQEASFVTIGQRFLANPLRVRFHYGHPDVFDRVFHITRGGISKASKTINLSEDVFAGYNSTLRRGYITYNEYMQVGKGRDVGLNQISKFEAKVANGNSEQTLSRDIYRLGRRFDFFRMLSCYFTTISILGVYIFLYGQLYLVLSGVEKALLAEAQMHNIESLETALASQSFLQLGLLTGLPMVMELGLEKGFYLALSDFILMQLQLASVFFTFSLGTKAHHFGRTILHGGSKYRPTGRRFVAFHASFAENYQLYSRSHFVKGFELLFLLIVYNMFRKSYESSMVYFMVTYSTWFMAATWLFAPFLFNPSGFVWRKIVEDWTEWNKWMKNQGGIGVRPDKSWESWWNAEHAHLRHSGLSSRILEGLLSLRFFIYQYGLVYHLDISQENKNFTVYVLSWLVIVAVFVSVKIVQVLRPNIERYGIWEPIRVIAQAYDYGMGSLLFAPIAALAWMPVISAIQTRVLFHQAFYRQLQIQPILAAKRKHRFHESQHILEAFLECYN